MLAELRLIHFPLLVWLWLLLAGTTTTPLLFACLLFTTLPCLPFPPLLLLLTSFFLPPYLSLSIYPYTIYPHPPIFIPCTCATGRMVLRGPRTRANRHAYRIALFAETAQAPTCRMG